MSAKNINQISQDQKIHTYTRDSKCFCGGIADELSLIIKFYLVIGYLNMQSVYLFCDMIQKSHLI